MRAWKKKLVIGDVWDADEDVMSFEEKRDTIVRRLKTLMKWANRQDQDSVEWTFEELVEELAETTDYDEFNMVWHELYDWADRGKRLWIDLWTKPEEVEDASAAVHEAVPE